MKKLTLILSLILLTGCFSRESVKDNTIVFSGFLYRVDKVRVDSVDYLIVHSTSSGGGTAIIKHGDVKK